MYEYLEEEEHEMTPLVSFHDIAYAAEQDDVPQEEAEQTTTDETTEVAESTEPEFEYPAYVGEEWVPPADAEPTWYQEKYKALHGMLGSEELANKLVEANTQRLLDAEKDIENFKQLYIAHKQGNSEFLRQNFPEELAKIGINPVLNETEIDTAIEQKLKEEFGDDYADVFDQKQVIKPTSISAKIFNRSQELVRHYETENQRREQLIQGYQPKQVEQSVPLDYDKEYEADFKDVPREQYDTLVNKLKEDYPTWTLKKLLRVVTYEDDLARAKEEGRAEERAKTTKELKTIGNAKPISREERKESTDDGRPKVYGDDWTRMFNNAMGYN